MLRSLLLGAVLCLPVALDAQTDAASPPRIDALQTDMRLVKEKFLDLLTDMDYWTERIKALEVQNYLLMERLAELENGEGDDDLSRRVAGLEERAFSEEFVAKLADSLETLQDLGLRLDELEARIGTTQAGSPSEALPRDGAPTPISPTLQSYLAHTDGSGRLISIYRHEIGATQAENLVAAADCESIGTWFEESFSARDYNAFFVRSDRGVRVCEKLRGGWRSLRAGETRRAHLITERH